MASDSGDAYTQYDGLGLSQLIARGELSAAELLEQSMARADRLNPSLNAIIHRFDERARTTAKHALPEGPFCGVPFLFKDLEDEFAGEPMQMGSRGVRFVPEQHTELVKRYLSTGLVPYGKTNTPELGLIITTEPKAHGPARNPWNKGHSTGGSSGGSAAAVAARIVPMASANDGGGSIRFPAACCGIFGLKPSRGRNPFGPRSGEGWGGAVAGHVVSLSVRDSAAMMDVTQGPELGAPFTVAPPRGSYFSASQQDPQPLRIGVSSKPMVPTEVHPEALEGLERTVALLQSLGHEVEEADPVVEQETLWRDFTTVVFAHTAEKALWLQQNVPGAYQQLEPTTISMARIGRSLSAVEMLTAQQGWHDVQMAMGRYLERYDMLLSPTLVNPPKALGELTPSLQEERLLGIANRLPVARWLYNSGELEKTMLPVLGQMAFTVAANITGLPAMSVPLHWTRDGLPLGMQFTGRICDEYSLFQLAGQLERAQPWFNRRPAL